MAAYSCHGRRTMWITLVNQYSGSGYSYSLSWSMYHVDFDWLGAMIKSVVYATTGNLIENFLILSICDQCYILLLFVCDGSIWNQYSLLNCLCILRVGMKFAKMSL